VPVEVLPFGWGSQAAFLQKLGAQVKLRTVKNGSVFITDQGNFILDCNFGLIHDPAKLARQLSERAGIIEHGLFIGLCTEVIVCGPTGCRRIRKGENAHDDYY
jgi:ribose 5-phosphate isomerase A